MNSSTSTNYRSNKDTGSVFDTYEIQYDVQLAANIIGTRMKLGLTQMDLAKKMKTVQPVVARAESGDTPPSHKLLKKIARAFGARLIPANFILEEQMLSTITVSAYKFSSGNEVLSMYSTQKPEPIPVPYVQQFSYATS